MDSSLQDKKNDLAQKVEPLEQEKEEEEIAHDQETKDSSVNKDGPPPAADNYNKKKKKKKRRQPQCFVMHEIGRVVSPFPLRAGTPRQGCVAPHVHSQIVLHPHICTNVADLVDGLQEYSHVWILFAFHLNAVGKGKQQEEQQQQEEEQQEQQERSFVFTATKVKPPRAKGKKVGALATRSPHRPNPLGLSVCFLKHITRSPASAASVIVQVEGLDLVNGTPVLDMKPFVPWDCPRGSWRFPDYVTTNQDVLSVHWTSRARQVVWQEQEEGSLAPLYPPMQQPLPDINDNDNDKNDAPLFQAIQEIVAQDPRGLHDGRGQETNSFNGKEEKVFEITFGSLRIGFTVHQVASSSSLSREETCRHEAWIVHAQVDQGDVTAAPGTYQHNLALRRLAERQHAASSTSHSKPLRWAHRLQEGVVWRHPDELYRLENGNVWRGAPTGRKWQSDAANTKVKS